MSKEIPGIYRWAKHEGVDRPIKEPVTPVMIDDETLRDGLQGVQIDIHPTSGQKKIYVGEASKFAEHFDIGYPGSEIEHQKEIEDLIRHSVRRGLKVSFSSAARASVKGDLVPIVGLSDRLDGYPLEADIFFDGSSYRSSIEGWDRSHMIRLLAENIAFLKKHNLPVMFVAERATATPPAELLEIFKIAADLGADRLCIADTNGSSERKGIRNIFRWGFEKIGKKYPNLKWDAHFHNDRGLALANCLTAAEEGVDRIHATMFCIGERAGNVDLVQLFLNLNLEGFRKDDPTTIKHLNDFARFAAGLLNYPIPRNTPVYGENAYATASGVHAAATGKESGSGEYNLYFPFDPQTVGREPQVEIGPFSGKANVVFKLRKLGINPTSEMVEAILKEAKNGRGLLADSTIVGIANRDPNGNKNG